MKTVAAILLLASLAIAQPSTQSAGPTSRTWELTPDGRWQPIASPAVANSAPVPEIERANGFLDERRYDAAFDAGVRWLRANRESPSRDQALYLVAQALYGGGDRLKAFYYCDELLDTYPESALWYSAVELQYKIAESFLDGWKKTFLGVPLFSRADEGVEMMFRIQQRAPGSPLAEQSLMRTADHYFDDEQYDLATDAYGVYITRYGRSPRAMRARLRQAAASYAQFAGVKFDPTPAIDARGQLDAILKQYPDLADRDRLQLLIDSIDRSMARKLLVNADLYRRTKRRASAAYLCDVLVTRYPQLPEAARARDMLATLPPAPISPTDNAADLPATNPAVPQ